MDDIIDGTIDGVPSHADSPHGSADYALRTTQQVMVHLSAMADQKASVVLGSSFVIATIVFGDVSGSSDLDAIRTLLLITATLAGIFAALALSPRMKFSEDATRQPLFFGSIAQMEHEEYEELMLEMLQDREKIHRTIIRDLHSSSRVLLASKFRPLQISYAVLVIGMLLTLIAALVS